MARHKAPAKTRRLVWRISDHAPLGEWVDPNLPPSPKRDSAPEYEHADETPGGWRRSTYDLMKGVDIDDNPNTVPDDLFDELFGPSKSEPKDPRK